MDGIEETIKEEALGSRFDELYRKVLSGCKITKEEKEFLLNYIFTIKKTKYVGISLWDSHVS